MALALFDNLPVAACIFLAFSSGLLLVGLVLHFHVVLLHISMILYFRLPCLSVFDPMELQM